MRFLHSWMLDTLKLSHYSSSKEYCSKYTKSKYTPAGSIMRLVLWMLWNSKIFLYHLMFLLFHHSFQVWFVLFVLFWCCTRWIFLITWWFHLLYLDKNIWITLEPLMPNFCQLLLTETLAVHPCYQVIQFLHLLVCLFYNIPKASLNSHRRNRWFPHHPGRNLSWELPTCSFFARKNLN